MPIENFKQANYVICFFKIIFCLFCFGRLLFFHKFGIIINTLPFNFKKKSYWHIIARLQDQKQLIK